MSPAVAEFLSLDLPALLALALASVSCGMLGNFLVLRRMSLMGDAIAHAVLPGLVLAFLVTAAMGHPEKARDPLLMMLGAALSGVATVVLVEVIQRFGRVEKGAAMGVAFSVMFALGVLLLEQAAARHVDLDADCVLYGQLESVLWLPADPAAGYFSLAGLADLPRQVTTLAFIAAATIAFTLLLYKELRIASFDPDLASTLGFRPQTLHYALMIFVAAAAVAAFEAVGSILVIALLICPAATARLLTDRYGSQLILTVLVALLASVGGYVLGTRGPYWIGLEHSVNAAGMVTVALGLTLALAIGFSPAHGLTARWLRRLRLSTKIAREDLLGVLYRLEEHGARGMPFEQSLEAVQPPVIARLARASALRRAEIQRENGLIALTTKGRDAARSLVRSHRLWETYLVQVLGLRPDHVHDTAMRLEHVLDESSGARLAPRIDVALDPHDRPIPNDDASAFNEPVTPASNQNRPDEERRD